MEREEAERGRAEAVRRGCGKEEKAALLALALLPGMEGRILRRLLGHHGSAHAAWMGLEDTPPALLGAGRSPERRSEWLRASRSLRPGEELEKLESAGIELLARGHDGYPPDLERIFDPPELLFFRGRVMPGGRLLAVVGSRRASSLGRHTAECLGRDLAQAGVGVVSGGALGIDAAAHRGSLEGGGPTFAVLGHGFGHTYPPEHRGLFRSIEEAGGLITEYAPGVPPAAWRFPERNRIIAGLCAGVVVVEGGEKSGALITAEYAMEEGREVLAVPGSVTSPLSRGPHRLIRQGAALVTCLDDIIEEMGWEERAGTGRRVGGTGAETPLSEAESSLLEMLDGEPRSIDHLLSLFSGREADLYLALSGLIVKGALAEEAGGRYVRIKQ